MTLVAHHAAHREPGGAGEVGERPASSGRAAAARQADVHVDEHLADAALAAAASTVSAESTATVTRASSAAMRAQAVRIDDLVREQQVVAEPGGGEPDISRTVAR